MKIKLTRSLRNSYLYEFYRKDQYYEVSYDSGLEMFMVADDNGVERLSLGVVKMMDHFDTEMLSVILSKERELKEQRKKNELREKKMSRIV